MLCEFYTNGMRLNGSEFEYLVFILGAHERNFIAMYLPHTCGKQASVVCPSSTRKTYSLLW